MAELKHPLFARFFDRLSPLMEKEVGPWRDQLLSGLAGRVVEVGPGNGMNFARYPATVEEVVAFEPEPYLRGKAEAAANVASITVSVRPGTADALDLPDASVDAAVASLVLCSVPDQGVALAELRRVIRPGGELRFLEHIRSGAPRKASLQSVADRSGIWPLIGGGCHCSRDTVAAIRAAGFEVVRVQDVNLGPSWAITNPHVIGVAVR